MEATKGSMKEILWNLPAVPIKITCTADVRIVMVMQVQTLAWTHTTPTIGAALQECEWRRTLQQSRPRPLSPACLI